ncbi:MAG TPA: hypothetical protein VFI95_15640 [Terriglobales bacterium]|nr:hypothetical protein [Terriglobales bacterium]
MELGSVIIVGRTPATRSSSVRSNTPKLSQKVSRLPVVCWDLLGQSVLRRMIDRLHRNGVQLISVVDSYACNGAQQQELWEKAVMDYTRNGVHQIFLLELGAYAELEFQDLLSFHRENHHLVTNVTDHQGPVGVTLMQAKAVADAPANLGNHLSALASCSATYEFSGFVHRLSGAADYRQLVQYVLGGLCEAKPIGREVDSGVWLGDRAKIHPSARVLGPCFVGSKAKVRAGSVIGPGAAIERGTEIDCGTVIEGASILPRTYVAPGLRIANSVVDGTRVAHLGRKTEFELAESGLFASTESRASQRLLGTVSSLFAFGNPGLDLSTSSGAPVSLHYVRGNTFFE